jgi:hypothetical protein
MHNYNYTTLLPKKVAYKLKKIIILIFQEEFMHPFKCIYKLHLLMIFPLDHLQH